MKHYLLIAIVTTSLTCSTTIYAPVTTTVCVETEVAGIIKNAQAQQSLAEVSTTQLSCAHQVLTKETSDGGVKHHGPVITWILNELHRRKNDGGV